MADYRDMAAALSGGYGQDTGGITPDTLITLKNGKKATASDLLGMIKGYGQTVGSNLESLGRGGVASVIGAGGDLESFGRMGINKLYGAGGVNVSPTPVLPTSADILGMMPRGTATRPETVGMEELGGYMTPATAKLAGKAIKATEGLPIGMSIKDVSKRYPQQPALNLAQQRAALPVEQGGLGLPANNTAADRAKAMGFVDELFHGTQRALEGILQFGGQTGYAGQKGSKANWFTTDPERASLYANIIQGAGNPTVYPVKIKSGAQISEDVFSNLASKLNLDQNPEISLYNKKLQKELQKQGFDEMTFNPGQTEEQYKVIFDPSNIRSRFAAFDPFRKDVATATAMGVALPDLLAAEKEDKQNKLSKALAK